MQLLNSKILSNDKNTRYSNKKAQDTRVTCAFLSVVAFSYYKDVYVRQNLVFRAIFESVSNEKVTNDFSISVSFALF